MGGEEGNQVGQATDLAGEVKGSANWAGSAPTLPTAGGGEDMGPVGEGPVGWGHLSYLSPPLCPDPSCVLQSVSLPPEAQPVL